MRWYLASSRFEPFAVSDRKIGPAHEDHRPLYSDLTPEMAVFWGEGTP